jgi:hypothetical protein
MKDFSGGLNNYASPLELKDNCSPKLLNIINYQNGVCETRPGVFKYITDILPETINRIYVYETNSFHYFLLSSATKLYKVSVGGGVPIIICDVANTISGFQHEDKFYFVDGQKYREYDGTDVYEIIETTVENGIAQSGTSSGIALASTSDKTDGHYNGWYITIVSGTGLNQSNTIEAYTGSNQLATVTNAWTIQPDNTSVYYLTPHPQGESYRDTTAKTVTYIPTSHQFTDTFMGDNVTDMIKTTTIATGHKTRVVFAGDPNHKNIVYYSALDNPYYVPANQWLPPVTNNDDYVTGITSFNDVLAIFKSKTVFALYGWDETDFDLKEVTVSTGTKNPRTIQQVGNFLLYFGTDGHVYSLMDVRTDYKKLLSKDLMFETIDLQKDPINIMADEWNNAFAISYQNRYYMAIKDKILIYTGVGWIVWDNLKPTEFIKYDNQLLMTNQKKYIYRISLNRFYQSETFTATQDQLIFTVQRGYINEIHEDVYIYVNDVLVDNSICIKKSNTTFQIPNPCNVNDVVRIEYLSLLSYNDDGDSYSSYWESPDLYYGRLDKTKQFRYIWVTADTFKYFTSQLNVNAFIDYYDVNMNIVIENQIALWGIAKWGVTRFIDRNIISPRQIPVNRRGRTIRFRFETNCLDTPFRLFNVTGDVTLRDR